MQAKLGSTPVPEPNMIRALKSGCLFLSILLIVCGCEVGTRVQGQYYLNQEKYSEGVAAFSEKLRQNPFDPAGNYYMGRYLLALNRPNKAVSYLKEAVALDFKNANYHFWLGVCYNGLKKPKMERASYLKAIAFDQRHVSAHLYLGHSYLENGQWKKALNAYDRVLNLQDDHAQALYNRGLVLNQMQRIPEETAAWQQYLKYYPHGKWSLQAVAHLNARGNFEYRNYTIGAHTVSLKRIQFAPSTGAPLDHTQPSLDVIGSILSNDTKVHLSIIVHLNGNKSLARRRAIGVRDYLIHTYPTLDPARLTVLGIGASEKIKAGWKTYRLDDSVNFVTIKK
jgi:tetratricopeptide (TPR) repeat protein